MLDADNFYFVPSRLPHGSSSTTAMNRSAYSSSQSPLTGVVPGSSPHSRSSTGKICFHDYKKKNNSNNKYKKKLFVQSSFSPFGKNAILSCFSSDDVNELLGLESRSLDFELI